MKSNPIRYGLLLFLPSLLALSFPIHSTKAGAERAVSAPGPITLRALQAALPQQPAPSDESTVIRVSTNLVAVPVSVTNAAGQPIKNLSMRDFTIEEDGKPQPVAQLGEPGQTPVELALLFDISGSVNPRFEFEQKAASKFLREVARPLDNISIFSIGPEPKLVKERSGDVNAAEEGLLNIQPTRGATAFYDSVVMAANYLQKNSPPGTRRVQVVVSDGEDNFSDRNRLIDAMREVQRADCLFYAINPSGPSIRLNRVSLKGHEAMEALASQSGGAAFLPDKIEELTAIFARIATELQAQYLLAYYSPDQKKDGRFRRIAVRIPNRPELRVRARQGYYTAAPS